MSFLGFDALGRLALGQLPQTSTPPSLVFSTFSTPLIPQPKRAVYKSFVGPPVANPAPPPGVTIEWVDYLPRARPQEGFITQATLPIVAAVVQPYVFSPFEQPQFKKLTYAQPSRFNSPLAYQPYVFSTFAQPTNVRSKNADTPTFTFFNIPVSTTPNFSGFTDFALPWRLTGTQRKQDGSSVDFTVLPMPVIISPLVFFGFYDFGLRPPSTSYKFYEQPKVTNLIAIPPPIPLESAFGGKRWVYQETKKTPEHKKKEPKVIPLDSSNLVDMSYDEEAKNLKIQFKTYKYENVSPSKAKALQNAESHGKYFHKNIKNQHPTTLIKTRTK